MKTILSYFYICVFCLFSCNADNKTKPLKADDVIAEEKNASNEKDEPLDEIERIAVFSKCTNYDNNLSTVAAEVDYISLDVEPPVSDFHTTDIQISDEYIFVAGIYHIYQYDKTGKFIRKIGNRGQGPKEYVQLGIPIQIDRDNDLIYGLDTNRRRIVVYRFDGSFAKAISYKYEDDSGGLTVMDSTRIVFRQVSGGRFNPNSPILHFINGEGKKIKTYYSHLYPIPRPTERNAHLGPDTNPLWESDGKFYSLEYGSDTIFQIVKDSLIPTRILTGDLKLTFAEHFIRNYGKKLSIFPYVLRPNAGIFESDLYLIFKLSSQYEDYYSVYNKKTKTFHRTYYNVPEEKSGRKNMAFFIDDMILGLPFNPQYQSQGKAIAWIPAATICEKKKEIMDFIATHPSEKGAKLKTIIQNMQEDDNSLLMLVRFK